MSPPTHFVLKTGQKIPSVGLGVTSAAFMTYLVLFLTDSLDPLVTQLRMRRRYATRSMLDIGKLILLGNIMLVHDILWPYRTFSRIF